MLAVLRRHDPDGYALRRAVRTAVVVSCVVAFMVNVVGDHTAATFATFGCFALLLFVDFPGSRATRFNSYLTLAVVGAVLIVIGTACSRSVWAAVLGMVVVGFVVLFAGVLSAAAAAAGRAALLTFILPVSLPAGLSDVGVRLAGWGVALICAIPAALFVWPPRDHDRLRSDTAAACQALGESLARRLAGGSPAECAAALDITREALVRLRMTFRGTAYRPIGLTTGSRALGRMVEELEWLNAIIAESSIDQMRQWPALARDTANTAARVLRASGQTLDPEQSPTSDRESLDDALADLRVDRAAVETETKAALVSADGFVGPYQAHEITREALLVGSVTSWVVAADRRSYLSRLLGRRPDVALVGALTPATQLLGNHAERSSVWFRNSVRGAVGLGLAVLVAQLAGTQDAFWVVLAAMSVLRSNALSVGSTVLRAVGGTVIGFAVGGAVVYAIGTNHAVLWAVLPVAVLFAAYAPEAISFAAGQAGFTVTVLIVFNILQPVGWRLGIVRVEDVLLGCGCSLVVGLLFWPRGAAGAVDRALGEAYRSGAELVRRAVEYVTLRAPAPDPSGAVAASQRMDDALRQYLAERGNKPVALDELTKALNGATRLRLAGQAIAELHHGDPAVELAFFARANELLAGRAATIDTWYTAAASGLGGRDGTAAGSAAASSRPEPVPGERGRVYQALRTELAVDDAPDDAHLEHARRLLWTALYLRDLEELQSHLVAVVDDLTQHPTAARALRG